MTGWARKPKELAQWGLGFRGSVVAALNLASHCRFRTLVPLYLVTSGGHDGLTHLER